MPRKGFLLVTMEPPVNLEGEFNDWYDTEHVPERRRVPGFETATRFICVSGWPRYLAFYDLRDPSVIDSPAYRAISNERYSPWTKRMLKHVTGFYRTFGEQIYPGDALCAVTTRLYVVRCHGIPLAEEDAFVNCARNAFEKREEVRQVCIYHGAESTGGDYLVTLALNSLVEAIPESLHGLGRFTHTINLMNAYSPFT